MNWWKNRGKDLNAVKGRPTPELAAQSRALLDEAQTQIREELAKTSPEQLKAPDRAELTRQIRATLADFHFSDTEADRVAAAMADAVLARLAAAS